MYPVDLLPSPLHIVNDALWVLQSLRASRRVSPEVQPVPADFDVNIQTNTGFFPPQPLPKLQKPFDVWEDALSQAQNVLKLGEDLLGDDSKERTEGELWREQIRSVSHENISHMTRVLTRIKAPNTHYRNPSQGPMACPPCPQSFGIPRALLRALNPSRYRRGTDSGPTFAGSSAHDSFTRPEIGSSSYVRRHRSLELGACRSQATCHH